MTTRSSERPAMSASQLIRNDYLNEYVTSFMFFAGDGKDFFKHGKGFFKPRSFTERYHGQNPKLPSHQINIGQTEQSTIEELDRLSVKASELLDDPIKNKAEFLDILKRVATICGAPDIVEEIDQFGK